MSGSILTVPTELLKVCLPNDVLLNGIDCSGTDDERLMYFFGFFVNNCLGFLRFFGFILLIGISIFLLSPVKSWMIHHLLTMSMLLTLVYFCIFTSGTEDDTSPVDDVHAVVFLYLHVRYGAHGSKVTRHISFSERLDLRPYMSASRSPSVWYQLYAVLVHNGCTTNSGHYYCYIRAPGGAWHCMNDSSVTTAIMLLLICFF